MIYNNPNNNPIVGGLNANNNLIVEGLYCKILSTFHLFTSYS